MRGRYIVEEYVNYEFVKQGEFDSFDEALELLKQLHRGRIREFRGTYWKTVAKNFRR